MENPRCRGQTPSTEDEKDGAGTHLQQEDEDPTEREDSVVTIGRLYEYEQLEYRGAKITRAKFTKIQEQKAPCNSNKSLPCLVKLKIVSCQYILLSKLYTDPSVGPSQNTFTYMKPGLRIRNVFLGSVSGNIDPDPTNIKTYF